MKKFAMKIQNKEIKNAIWIISGKVVQMALSFIVSILSARYLGPSNLGVINYVQSYVAFFTAFCTLGINGLIINDFVEHPNEEGTAIGTTILMRAISSLLSGIMIVAIVSILDRDEPITKVVAILCSLSLIFNVFDTINFWFQSRYKSKFSSLATLIGYIATTIYKLFLLICRKSVVWFALASSIDYAVIALALLIIYKRCNGPKFKYSYEKGKQLLSKSYHFILASMMVAIYGQTDKLMLKQMLSEAEVGYYSIATSVCSMWTFILTAIIDSIYPTIINLKKDGQEEAYKQKNIQLYTIVLYASISVSILLQFFGRPIVLLLYGDAYAPSISVLKIVTWYTAFSYLGVARGAWLVCENKQKYLKYMYVGAAICNVLLNFSLIPIMSASGAALASLITQMLTSIVIPFCVPAMRENAIMMIDAIRLSSVKQLLLRIKILK